MLNSDDTEKFKSLLIDHRVNILIMRDVIKNFNEFKSIRLDINKNRKLFITLRVCQGSIGKNVTLYNR